MAILTIEKGLMVNEDATFDFAFNTDRIAADQVVANGVTITGGAILTLADNGTVVLPSGTAFTLIGNTAATPISGTFSNLADDSTLTIGGNTFQVDYEGGDGNDLTLTVVL